MAHLHPAVRLARRHPLTGYFLLTFTLSWTWMAVALGVLRLPMLGIGGALAPLVGPALAAFVLTALTQGRAGIRDLLRRLVLWRVSPWWYAIVLLGWPALLLLLGFTQGASAQAPAAAFWGLFLLILVTGGPLGEEPGWRGFALPLLQQRHGPLAGTLVLGVLHGLWHLPVYVLVPGYNGAPADPAGLAVSFATFVGGVTAGSVLFTWIFNNTRGSVLLAVLFHAVGNVLHSLAYELFPGADLGHLVADLRTLAQVGLALLVVAATRGRLGHDRYLREVPPVPDAGRARVWSP
ncbi:CPBP family intramembrane glutamic endopeptidase [Nonomuraea sp. NPDC050310]|uniref:CPBP family intramembrane glutamic endopeptidase n=1 Tax=Nonomuraea sp. NPDC050310 TaxID=3154935 RepID=UPI0033C5C632